MHIIYAIISRVSITYIMQINAILLLIELTIITVMYPIAVELFIIMFLAKQSGQTPSSLLTLVWDL